MIPKKFHPDRETLIQKGLTEPHGVPAKVIAASYYKMLKHVTREGGLTACKATGASIKVKMFRNVFIFDRPEIAGGEALFKECTVVGVIYCAGCDKVPDSLANTSVWSEEVMSVAL